MTQCKAGHLAIHNYMEKRKIEEKNLWMIYFLDIENVRDAHTDLDAIKRGRKKDLYKNYHL